MNKRTGNQIPPMKSLEEEKHLMAWKMDALEIDGCVCLNMFPILFIKAILKIRYHAQNFIICNGP